MIARTTYSGVEGKPPPPGPSGVVSIRFGVDVLQPVLEERPTVLVGVEAAAANAEPRKLELAPQPVVKDLELD